MVADFSSGAAAVIVAVDADTLVEVATRTPNIEQDWDDPNFDYDKYYKEVQDNTQMILKKLSMDGTVIAEEDVTELFKGQYLSYSMADEKASVRAAAASDARNSFSTLFILSLLFVYIHYLKNPS